MTNFSTSPSTQPPKVPVPFADRTAAVNHDPSDIVALNNLAAALQDKRRFAEAEQLLRRALLQAPDAPFLVRNLAQVLASSGRRDEALELFARAYELAPDDPHTQIGALMAELPVTARTKDEAECARRSFASRLSLLETRLSGASSAEWARYAEAVGSATPFYLSYQGAIDRDLYARYGAFAARAMAAAYPEWAALPKGATRRPGPIRVGFISGFFFYHSVFKIPLQGWLRTFDRSRFELFAYHTKSHSDACTDEAKRAVSRFVEGPRSTEGWCEAIREDDLDAVIFPDTVMDPMSCRLALLRHAPVQCATWGHPCTTGFPTIDYFLSSDAMEPEGAATHYTESLIRLPRLGVYVDREPGPRATNLANVGLPPGVSLVWCCQSLYKYLPLHDDLFARIAERVPSARFVFIEGTAHVTAVFEERLRTAFAARGLVSSSFVVFVKPVSPSQFSVYTSAMTLALDSVGWSGCNSSLETLAHDVPIVTMRGATMRASHTAGMFDIMGLASHVSLNADDYVERAAGLLTDPALVELARAEIHERKGRLLRDLGTVRVLERFLEIGLARPRSSNGATGK